MLFDGILFSPLVTQAELLEMDAVARVPLVLLGEHEFQGRFDHVAIDNVRAAEEAVAHLVARGRRRIAAIGAQPLEPYATPQQRTAGYERALESAGIERRTDYARAAAHYSRADGYAVAKALLALSPRPDAIFCFSDLLAMGAMRAVFDAGLTVPDDVAVVGIDDIEEGRYSRPTLTSVSLDTAFIAEQAVSRLVDRIDDDALEVEQIIAPHTLMVRESSGG